MIAEDEVGGEVRDEVKGEVKDVAMGVLAAVLLLWLFGVI